LGKKGLTQGDNAGFLGRKMNVGSSRKTTKRRARWNNLTGKVTAWESVKAETAQNNQNTPLGSAGASAHILREIETVEVHITNPVFKFGGGRGVGF